MNREPITLRNLLMRARLKTMCDVIDRLIQVYLRRKVGRDGLGTFAAFRMLLAKIGAEMCCCSQLASHASVGKIRL
jgi:hypothetical protein